MKKVTISVASKDYTITLEDAFAEAFLRDMELFLGKKKGLDTKELLSAFVQKSYDFYAQECQMQALVPKIEQVLREG
ncbi:hypothetical protein JWV37_03710 [Sulfurospirillum sp. T05]|uniref:Cell division protein ZapA n=1 Tax=Sulfurospirillum tamanense TaxID=2813362 RepID=A0ABS2WR61_9BACT|nr:hypothetical protein [Sulfurospirillum tamanensis]MBN2963878.1 hypothetical protein [Sulfurospirillum tamanensis]